MNRINKISLDLAFILLLSLIQAQAKPLEKYFIELPQGFYLNLTSQTQNPSELWHPRLTISQITEGKSSNQVSLPEKKIGLLKEKAYKGTSSFLEISRENFKEINRSFLEITSESSNPKIQRNKMSCACKFIPEFAGSNLQKETNLLQNNKINSEETMLIQTESNVQGKPKTNEVLKVKKETDYIENIETITNSKENNENTDNLPIKKKTNKQENNNEEKELFEMYQKLEKIFKKEETSPSENIPFNSQEQPQPLIQQIFQQPQKEFLQNPTQKILKLPQQQPQQRLILSNSNNPYILQPVMVQQNPIQYTNNYQQIPQEMNYGYVDYNGYNSNDLQNNVRYVTVQKPQQKIIVLPEKQLPQQIVYVNNEGQIVY